MKAAQVHQYGGAEFIKVSDIDKPIPASDQVVVEVYAASINPFDTAVREGYVKDMIKQLPATLGGDVAGIVAETGVEVTDFKVGEKVYGQAAVVAGNSGAFAEYAATKSNQLAKMPANLDFIQAASLPLVGLSALQAITEHINLQKAQKILIHGGSGGIGTVAIQIAKDIGAYVATTATGPGIEYVRKLGADEIIDYKTQEFDKLLKDYDAVFDTVAGETYKKSFKVLRKGGIIVSMLEQPNQALMKEYNVRSIAQQTSTTTESLNEITELVEKGIVSSHIGQIYPLDQVKEAFLAREKSGLIGKVVLEIKK